DLRLLWQELPPAWAQVPVAPPVLGGLLPGPSELWLRLKQNEALPGPAVELEGKVGALHLLLPPSLLGTLRGLLGALDPPGDSPDHTLCPSSPRAVPGAATPPPTALPPQVSPGGPQWWGSPIPGCLWGSPIPRVPLGVPTPGGAVGGSLTLWPGRGPPWHGGLRVQVTLGTVTAVLPEEGGAPCVSHERLWAELCDGHTHPAWDHALPFPHLRYGHTPYPVPHPGVPSPPRMLALALGSSLSPHEDIKELVVAVALEGVMLRHRPDPPGIPWYSQLLALLALEDEPVLGYTPPTPLTHLHLHLQRCSLDYR
ncbi:ATG2B protein, partial [Dasyornis broadbenti]|nr:ATG2B protein [Dasyornis broadbenti]